MILRASVGTIVFKQTETFTYVDGSLSWLYVITDCDTF